MIVQTEAKRYQQKGFANISQSYFCQWIEKKQQKCWKKYTPRKKSGNSNHILSNLPTALPPFSHDSRIFVCVDKTLPQPTKSEMSFTSSFLP
jgi:hypothetical protein